MDKYSSFHNNWDSFQSFKCGLGFLLSPYCLGYFSDPTKLLRYLSERVEDDTSIQPNPCAHCRNVDSPFFSHNERGMCGYGT